MALKIETIKKQKLERGVTFIYIYWYMYLYVALENEKERKDKKMAVFSKKTRKIFKIKR
jgi:hypothetical protein